MGAADIHVNVNYYINYITYISSASGKCSEHIISSGHKYMGMKIIGAHFY